VILVVNQQVVDNSALFSIVFAGVVKKLQRVKDKVDFVSIAQFVAVAQVVAQ
jgi:hypothetical protein